MRGKSTGSVSGVTVTGGIGFFWTWVTSRTPKKKRVNIAKKNSHLSFMKCPSIIMQVNNENEKKDFAPGFVKRVPIEGI
jgi:hypothetical protein